MKLVNIWIEMCCKYKINTGFWKLKLKSAKHITNNFILIICIILWMWECIKKAECQRIDAFELWCWRRLLRVPWTARRSNQSILKEIRPGCLLEGLMLKLKLQYFGHLMRRTDSLEKTPILKAGGEGNDRGQDVCMSSLTQWTWVWAISGKWWRTVKPGLLWSMESKESDLSKLLNNNSLPLVS